MSESRFSYSLEQLQEMSARMLKLAQDAGASAAETDISLGIGQNVTAWGKRRP
jgi:PmbA protein